jgi:hypothetical protein
MIIRISISAGLFIFVGSALSAQVLSAQSPTTGAVSGFIYEKIGGKDVPLPSVRVLVVEKDTKLRRGEVTRADGQYVIKGLPAGRYYVDAECVAYQRCVAKYLSPPESFLIEVTKNKTCPVPPIYLQRAIAGKRAEILADSLLIATQILGNGAMIQPEFRIGDDEPSILAASHTTNTQTTAPSTGRLRAQLVNAVTATREGNIDQETLIALPLPGVRALESLAFLFPGVAPPPQTLSQTVGPGVGSSVGTSGQFSVNGLRSRANNFTIDGSDNNDEDIGVRRQGFTTLVPQSVESVQEYHIATLLPAIQFGRNLGGQIDIVSRKGSPQFHGSVYGFYTNQDLRARDYFDRIGRGNNPALESEGKKVIFNNNELILPNPVGGENKYDRGQYGFVLGGPMGRLDRTPVSDAFLSLKTQTMFFVAAERQVIRANRESHFAVPLAEDRGLFKSGAKGLCLVGGGVLRMGANCSTTDTLLYPASGVGSAVFSFFPFPNNPDGPYNKNTFTQILPSDARGHVFAFRLDRAFNGTDSKSESIVNRTQALSGRYNFADDDTLLPVTGGALFSSLRAKVRAQNAAFFYNVTLAPHLVTELRGSYGRTSLKFTEATNPIYDLAPELRNPALLPPEGGFKDSRFLLNAQLVLSATRPTRPCIAGGGGGQPCFVSQSSTAQARLGPLGQVVVSGFSPIGVDVLNFPQTRVNNTIQVADIFFYSGKKHRLTTGIDLRRIQLNSFLGRNFRPLVVFNGAPDLSRSRLSQSGYYLGSDFAAVGAPTSFIQTYAVTSSDSTEPDPTIGLRSWQTEAFIADEFRPRQNIVLTLGLRYQYSAPPSEVNSRIESNFNSDEIIAFIAKEKMRTAGRSGLEEFLAGRHQIYRPDRNNFAPHFGFAWSLFGGGSTVIRGGYGIYYDQIPGAVTSQSRNMFPKYLTVNTTGLINPIAQVNPQIVDPKILFALNPVTYALPGTLNTYNKSQGKLTDFLIRLNDLTASSRFGEAKTFPGGPGFTLPAADLPTSYAQHWGLTVEREWPKDFMTSLAYVGTRGVHLLRFTTPNLGINSIPVVESITNLVAMPVFNGFAFAPDYGRPFPLLGSFTAIVADSNSIYHSLQFELIKRLSYGVQLTTSYTWSHAIDEASDLFELASGPVLAQNSFDRWSERASASFDSRHNLVYSLVWNLPAANKSSLLNGWQLASIGVFRAGQPFTFLACCDVNLDGNLSDRLANDQQVDRVNRGPEVYRLPTNQYSLLSQTRVIDARGRVSLSGGSLGRNTFRSPGVAAIDLAVGKRFVFKDSRMLVGRAEFFNLFNRAHFGLPIHQLLFPSAGRSVDTRLPGLTVQFSLKYSF